MFYLKQLVVYPNQGVGIIERLEQQEVGGQYADFYIIRILCSNVTVMVPVKNASAVGLRKLCTNKQADKILNSFKDRSCYSGYTGQNWNRRYREYSERLKSSSLKDVSQVLKELILISGEKDLSFGERRLLEQAMNLVSSELACAMGRDIEGIKSEIEDFFSDILIKAEKIV